MPSETDEIMVLDALFFLKECPSIMEAARDSIWREAASVATDLIARARAEERERCGKEIAAWRWPRANAATPS
jgi:hypothetical protein